MRAWRRKAGGAATSPPCEHPLPTIAIYDGVTTVTVTFSLPLQTALVDVVLDDRFTVIEDLVGPVALTKAGVVGQDVQITLAAPSINALISVSFTPLADTDLASDPEGCPVEAFNNFPIS